MRRTVPVIAIALTGFLLAGCASASDSVPGADPAEAVDTDATIDVQVGLEPTSLDITTTSGASLQQLLIGNVYEGLVAKDAAGEIVPGLASAWSVSDDGLRYSFDLRQAQFHDGSELTVDDVVASLDAARAPESLNPDAKRMASVSTVTAIDADTVEVTLASRDIGFLDTLSITSAGMIVNDGESADLANTTNGTGPYGVSQWNKGSTITLERADGYWGDAPQNQSVVFHYITDATTAMSALAAGEVDILTNATAETVAYFDGKDDVTVTAGESTSWMTLGMNSASGALADATVRQAINRGIDKAGLIQALGGNAIEVGSMIVPSDPWFSDLTGVNSYDPDAARELLSDIDPATLTFTLTVANNYDTKISEYVAAQLAEIGITVTINTVEFSSWLDSVYKKKEYDLTLVLHVDPSTLSYYGNPAYYWNYDNAEAQQLAAQAKEAASFDERDENLAALAELVAADAASGWLYSPQTMVVASTAVSGYPVDRIANRFPVSGITAGQ